MGRQGNFTVHLEGSDELVAKLEQLREACGDVTRVLAESAKDVTAEALTLAPRRTGTLARSITSRATNNTATVAAGEGGKAGRYAAVIHWGYPKRHIDPQPFLFDAVAKLGRKTVDNLHDYIDEEIDRMNRSGTRRVY